MRRDARAIMAFLYVPFVATGAWYVLMLLYLLIGNGRLRLTTDVAAMALGGAILGLPVAAAITVVLAVPAYLLVRVTIGVSFASVVVAGAFVGLVAAYGLWMWATEWTFISPLRAVLIGTTSAAAWWYLAGGRDGIWWSAA